MDERTLGPVAATKLATDAECAAAWRGLMADTNPSTNAALMTAWTFLGNTVQARLADERFAREQREARAMAGPMM